ncbi:SpoIVB peptidase S55 domain-containing protein [uncultured Phascolarctobacterium sp.]|uniref:SpoIVB peptidase S55 domain-containing protein n=1 Tax=uncultured Phascolarctobacterium sp. TaxID=512296 RepID=UPI002607E2DB|nr:SpoIVB peptidase S55 domain-containing protein [uncultured Phascolarctobacterium sp.]
MRVFLFTVLLCLQLALVAAANVPLMPVRDIQPGMQGIGKTVISGDTIEEFNVEILGVSGTQATGYNIFARLYGDLIDKTGGVAQGMSGSPVYVDGRLVGAVAFGKTFNDPHYCFLTPIGRMLPLLDEQRSVPADWLPKGTALMAGGFTEYGLEYLQEKIAPFGLTAVGAGGTAQESRKVLEPGSSVGVALMQGDMSLGALGTVTWTDDKGNVLAFGHSFMQRGESSFFMTKAWVLGVIPNLQSGYKVGNIGEPVGSITQDRSTGIGGSLGALPKTIPLFVTANDSDRAQTSNVRVRLVEDEQLVPSIVDAVVVNTVSKTVDRAGGGTAKLRFHITGVDSKKNIIEIQRENMFYANEALLKNLNQELSEAMTILMQNKFEPVQLYGIDVEAEVSSQVQVAEVFGVRAPAAAVKPGARVPITVTLKPYRGEEFTKTVYFTVPNDHPGGKLALNVRGGSSMAWVMNLLRKQQSEGVPAAQKQEKRRKLEDFIKSVNTADKNNELIIDLASGQLSLKPEQAAAASEAGLAGMLQGSPFKQKYPFDFIIDGESEIVLNVEK